MQQNVQPKTQVLTFGHSSTLSDTCYLPTFFSYDSLRRAVTVVKAQQHYFTQNTRITGASFSYLIKSGRLSPADPTQRTYSTPH
jgi:hypothetical protein